MKRLQLPSLLAALALTIAGAHGQAPAPGAAPATPPAATPPAAPAAKPYPSGDVIKIKDVCEALQFSFKMGEKVKWSQKDDKDLVALGTRLNKEAADYITPLMNMTQAHGVDQKYTPQDMSPADKQAADRVTKAKPDKIKLDLLEFLSKNIKHNAHSVDAAAKTFTDPELKDYATKAAKMLSDQADSLEKMYKDLKAPKKK